MWQNNNVRDGPYILMSDEEYVQLTAEGLREKGLGQERNHGEVA